jgi:hypothetical protein
MFTSRYLLLLMTCLFSIAARSQTVAHPAVDTSIYAILNYDSSVDMAMDEKFNKAKPTTLSIAEVNDMEPLIDSSYQDYNGHNMHRQLVAPLSAYRRQYVAVINALGQKEVWINFFCSFFNTDWKHHVLIVDDGGICFFQLRINLSSKKAGELIPNGVA